MNVPWLVVGDFNQVLHAAEKKGGRRQLRSDLEQLCRTVDECHLIDIGFSGPRFTWSNMREDLSNIQERLDRGLCNQQWLELFSDNVVSHLPRTVSDHLPLLIHPPKQRSRPPECRFQVLSAWFSHPQFVDVFQRAWEGDCRNCLVSMDRFRSLAMYWNINVFGNIFWRKKDCLARLVGVQQKLSFSPSQYLSELEAKLRADLSTTLK